MTKEPEIQQLTARTFRPDRPRLVDAIAVLTGRPKDQLEGFAGQVVHVPNDRFIEVPSGPRFAIRSELAVPKRAWEALASAGVIPAYFADSSARSFVSRGTCVDCGGKGTKGAAHAECINCEGEGWIETATPYPDTVNGCLSIASDPEAIVTAEALARESVYAIDGGLHQHIQWQLVPADHASVMVSFGTVGNQLRHTFSLGRPGTAERNIAQLGYVLSWWECSPTDLRLLASLL